MRATPVNMPDPAIFGHYGQRAAGFGPDPVCRIRFSTFGSDPDRMLFFFLSLILFFFGGGGGGGALEVAQIIIIGSESGPFLYIWSGSDLVLSGNVRLWPKGSFPEASRCCVQ